MGESSREVNLEKDNNGIMIVDCMYSILVHNIQKKQEYSICYENTCC